MLVTSLTLCLITSTPNDQTPTPSSELGKAPPALEWPDDLPIPTQMPNGDLCLPRRTAGEIARQLTYWDSYPGLCQKALDGQRTVLEDSLKTSQQQLKEAEKDKGFPLWVIILTGTAGVLVGTIIGVDLAAHR